jgi:hypothetical protein
MKSSWQADTGHVACTWSELVQRTPYNPHWIQEHPNMQGSYLSPLPDFASHSPFSGATWFVPHTVRSGSE